MTKSSEVLRLAAEYSLKYIDWPLRTAKRDLGYDEFLPILVDCGYIFAESNEEECMVLCLAAAIAESEGD